MHQKSNPNHGMFERQIGKTLYEVHYFHSEHSLETVEEKIHRLIRHDMAMKP